MYGGFGGGPGGPGGPGGHGFGGPGGHGPGGPGGFHGGYGPGPGFHGGPHGPGFHGGYGPGPGFHGGPHGPGFHGHGYGPGGPHGFHAHGPHCYHGGPHFYGGFYGFRGPAIPSVPPSAVRSGETDPSEEDIDQEEISMNEPNTNTPSARAALHLATLSLLMGGMLLLANFLGAKIWHLGSIILDGGVIVFPIIYICGDLLVETFGKRTANRIAYRVCILNAVAALACLIVQHLPALPGTYLVGPHDPFALSVRVMIASIVGFLFSQLYNNWSFQRIRERTGGRGFWKRSLGSSIGAHIIDSAIFNTIAFLGRTRLSDFFVQMFCAIITGLLLEAVLNPLTARIAVRIREDIIGR